MEPAKVDMAPLVKLLEHFLFYSNAGFGEWEVTTYSKKEIKSLEKLYRAIEASFEVCTGTQMGMVVRDKKIVKKPSKKK